MESIQLPEVRAKVPVALVFPKVWAVLGFPVALEVPDFPAGWVAVVKEHPAEMGADVWVILRCRALG
jgi:hypothetical protein